MPKCSLVNSFRPGVRAQAPAAPELGRAGVHAPPHPAPASTSLGTLRVLLAHMPHSPSFTRTDFLWGLGGLALIPGFLSDFPADVFLMYLNIIVVTVQILSCGHVARTVLHVPELLMTEKASFS